MQRESGRFSMQLVKSLEALSSLQCSLECASSAQSALDTTGSSCQDEVALI